MGKGDRRSKRGKIFRGTYGKKRPKPQEERQTGQGGGGGGSPECNRSVTANSVHEAGMHLAVAMARMRRLV